MPDNSENKTREQLIEKAYEQLATDLPKYVQKTINELTDANKTLTIMFWASFILGFFLIAGGACALLLKPSWIPLGVLGLGVTESAFLLITKTPAKFLRSRVIPGQALAIFLGWFEVHDYLARYKEMLIGADTENKSGAIKEVLAVSKVLIENMRSMAEMVGIHVQGESKKES